MHRRGARWDVCGVGWGRAGERMAHEGDAFFGVRGREWAGGVGEGCWRAIESVRYAK